MLGKLNQDGWCWLAGILAVVAASDSVLMAFNGIGLTSGLVLAAVLFAGGYSLKTYLGVK